MLVSDTMPNVFVNNNYKMNGRVHLKTDDSSQAISECVTDERLCKFCDRLHGRKTTAYEQFKDEEERGIAHGDIYYNGDHGDKKSAFNGKIIKMFCIFCSQYYEGPKKVEYAREPLEMSKTKMASLSENLAPDNDSAKIVIDEMPFENGRKSPSINADLMNEESGSERADPYEALLESNEKEKMNLNGQICQRDESTESASDEMSSEAVDGDEKKIELGGNLPFKESRKIKVVTNGVLFESAQKTYKNVLSEVPPKMDQENKIIPAGRMAEIKTTYIACVGKPFMSCEKAKAFCYGAPPVAGFPTLH